MISRIELEEKVEPHFLSWGHQTIDCGEGWDQIISDLVDKLVDYPEVKIFQIKEKFGGLRFYTEPYNESFEKNVREAERLSFITCEICGKPGSIRDSRWIQTLCNEHYTEEK